MLEKNIEVIELERNPDLDHYDDETLVSLSQKDIDSYRFNCHWKCKSCDKIIDYDKSLIIKKQKYVHELKCNKCKKIMTLNNLKDSYFDSLYFNELFARYQNYIITESVRCKDIESPDEVYSILCGVFMKIVGKFARDNMYSDSKRSTKWFSSYFWRSTRNRTADIVKTNNYNKRCPSVKCAICQAEVGNISSKHLLSQGHEQLLEQVYFNIGDKYLEGIGEDVLYSNEEEYKKRCLFVANNIVINMDSSQVKSYLGSYLTKVYNKMYPSSLTKNFVLSVDEFMDRDEEFTMNDFITEDNKVFGNKDVYLNRVIEDMIDIHVKRDIHKFEKYFKDKVELDRRLQIIKEMIFDKTSYKRVSDREIDKTYRSEVNNGFASNVMRHIGSDEKCKQFLLQI